MEVAREGARDASALLAEAVELGCIFLSFAKGIVGMLLEVEGLVEEDAEELVGCGWAPGCPLSLSFSYPFR